MAMSLSKALRPICLALGCLIATANSSDVRSPLPAIHPKVFQLVESWISDTEQPVVTEVNLDAVTKNRNQFDFSTVRTVGEWIEYTTDNDQGFHRFRERKSSSGCYAVEYQSNGGGTLTTASIIEFTIEQRELQKDGKPISVRVLRVASVASK